MTSSRLASSADLPPWAIAAALALAALSFILLAFEMRRRERGGGVILVSGVLAVVALLVAVLRPVRIAARESTVGARVLLLADASRSMALPQPGGGTRADARDRAIRTLFAHANGARFLVQGFGEGAGAPLDIGSPVATASLARRSDLAAALRAIEASPEERPRALVVISDGRLDDPPEGASREALRTLAGTLGVPIHTVATTRDAPKDASLRRVGTAGAAVAHVPFPLRVEEGYAGGLV